MEKTRILWADDEIEMLTPHIIFLENKGFEVTTVTNGNDALDEVVKSYFDIVFLDENMPGKSGLETLIEIKKIDPGVPVVMITKSEEESIMDQAVGGNIADYLIKPVNPHQVLLSLKKNLQKRELRARAVTSGYQSAFSQLGIEINDSMNWEDWPAVYQKLVFWELELEGSDNAMDEVLKLQKNEANSQFVKYVKKHYRSWFTGEPDRPMLSHELFKKRIFPLLDDGKKVFLMVIDNLRYDQWRALRTIMSEFYSVDSEELYYSILPTATQYARNAIFSGLMPLQIKQMYPDLWTDEEEEESKNQFENELIGTQLDRFRKRYEYSYHKILDSAAGNRMLEALPAMMKNPLNVVVFNFVDMLSHARTEVKTIRELTNDEAAYRSLAMSWFSHSAAFTLLKTLAEKDVKVIITTDHGSIRVKDAVKVIGDKNTNTNIRYKVGKNLNYNAREVYEITRPEEIQLPSPNVSSKYVFAVHNDFLAYPNNFNHYVNYYRDTFQHGGISMEEMLVPFAVMSPKHK